jgi:hypothetical protein
MKTRSEAISMNPRYRAAVALIGGTLLALAIALPFEAEPLHAQTAGVALDTVRAGPLDAGRMWTFEHAPAQYFSETYGFRADSAWFAHARLAALRIPGCSAAFVSPHGLVATNHHCVRNQITSVQRESENLLDDGFFAHALGDERRIANYYVDQLVAIEDVSDEIFVTADDAADDAARQRARQAAIAAIQARLRAAHQQPGTQTQVQIVPLYHGGRYSAYVFRRYPDVRLVAAPELQLGFFGGDPDNFTYPRYALDFAFLRVYDEHGEPLRPSHHFRFSRTGAEEGEAVFVIGNPGRTSRLLTIAQLEFLRDVQVPAMLAFLDARLVAMREFLAQQPEQAEPINLRNRIFSLSNAQKGSTGRLAALRDPVIMARRADAERTFRARIEAQPELRERWGAVTDSLAAVQRRKRGLAAGYTAFHRLGDASADARAVRRALIAVELDDARRSGAPADSLRAIEGRLRAIGDHPAELELRLLAARFRDFDDALGADHPLTRAALQGRTAAAAAAALLRTSALGDSARLAAALNAGALPHTDAGMMLVAQLGPAHAEHQERWAEWTRREAQLDEQLGRARFAVYGTEIPPDATGSPRISDGVVTSYPYNGTIAPAHTTFFGMYDRHHAFGPGSEWDLPARWLPAPPALQLGTALNFVSTADTFSGNSGSPAVTRALEIVGFNFDRNIEGLSRDYIYLPERGRNIMVDVRAIRASLAGVYGLERIVTELDDGTLPRR